MKTYLNRAQNQELANYLQNSQRIKTMHREDAAKFASNALGFKVTAKMIENRLSGRVPMPKATESKPVSKRLSIFDKLRAMEDLVESLDSRLSYLERELGIEDDNQH
jgi:hypothetical protein